MSVKADAICELVCDECATKPMSSSEFLYPAQERERPARVAKYQRHQAKTQSGRTSQSSRVTRPFRINVRRAPRSRLCGATRRVKLLQVIAKARPKEDSGTTVRED